MMCSRCNLEKLGGKVVKGAFVCDKCLAVERTEKKKAHVDAQVFYQVRVMTQVPDEKRYLMTKATADKYFKTEQAKP